MKVENMIGNSGREVSNQFIIRDRGFVYFQSYGSMIARRNIKTGLVTLDRRYWDYSVTTGKYRNQFLNETKKETQKKIDQGVYKLADLN